jgi:hypothetical protein
LNKRVGRGCRKAVRVGENFLYLFTMIHISNWLNNRLNKSFYFLIAYLVSAGTIQAQVFNGTVTDTTRYISGFNPNYATPDCIVPKVKSVGMIRYTTKAIARVTLEQSSNTTPNLSLRVKGDAGNGVGVANTQGVITLDNLQPNQAYEIRGVNSCGNPVVITEFTTYQFRPGEDGIRVSDNLYRHIVAYTAIKSGAVPLHQYIESLPDVNEFEKREFVANFFLKGAILPDAAIGQSLTPYVQSYLNGTLTDGDGGGDEEPKTCLCEFILNQGSFAIPDKIPENLTIDRVHDASNGPFGNASRWWYNSTEAGPAKFRHVSSDGWKDGNTKYKKIFDNGAGGENSGKSPSYAKMSYTFLCVNYPNATPEECGCNKIIRVKAEYTSKVDTRATTRNCWCADRESWALAQDFAALFVSRDNTNTLADVQILDAGSNILRAECSDGVPASALINSAGAIAGSVVNIIKAVKTGQLSDLGTGIEGLTQGISSVFEANEKHSDCEQTYSQNTLVQSSTTLTLKPNEPLSVVLLSGDRLEAGGKRAWDSRAQVNSDFYLTGVLLGSNSAPGETHCCTDYSAQWVYATENRVISSLQIPINNHIFSSINGAGNITVNGVPYVGNNYSSGSEIGHATADFPGCEKKVPIFTFR